MSSCGSDPMSVNVDRNLITSSAESLLASITEVAASVLFVEIEQETFFEIGCYLYRSSFVVMEWKIAENVPENVSEVLQSLAMNISLAKDLVGRCRKGATSVLSTELKEIIQQLEGAIKCIGKDLNSIPASTYGDQEYVKVSVQSLIKEMGSVILDVSQVQISENKDKELDMTTPVKQQQKEEPSVIESDLYSIDVEISIDNPQISDLSYLQMAEYRGSVKRRAAGYRKSMNLDVSTTYHTVTHMEPLYETFFCPLTQEIMDDPVTIESGVTYERKAISEWFEKFRNSEEIVCPKTGQKLMTRVLSTNIALKSTIEEWQERNEASRIKVARAALSLASTDKMVLEALKDLQSICKKNQYNKVQVRSSGMIPLLAKLLDYKERNVRCLTLELLRLLVEDDDDEGKEMIANTTDLEKITKMLSSNDQSIRHASLLLMLELSRSQSLSDLIGSVRGAILMMITLKYRESYDSLTSEVANGILKNLEKSPDNIKYMAKNGYLEPLLDNLFEGCEEIKMEMASCLGGVVFGPESKTYVAERASPTLVKMVQTGNSLTRNAAFQALKHISFNCPNSKILVEAGVAHIMVEEMFSRTIYNEPMNSKKEAAAILANILESGLELDNLQVNNHGHTMSSDYIIYNIIYSLKNKTPDELNINLLRILVSLMKSNKSSTTIVSVIKETDVSCNLIEFINNPNEELGIAAIKLLVVLSPHMGHTLADKLCKTGGQPESLIQSPSEVTRITEKHAISVKFLGKLPHQNLTLNLALLNKNTVYKVLQNINQVQRIGLRTSRHASVYLEGLVAILARFTATLYDHQVLFLAKDHNFTSVFTELLVKTSSDEVQRLSAVALLNLSSQSVNLSRKPQVKTSKYMKMFLLRKCLSLNSRKYNKISLCPVHRGICSSQETFCLLDAKAVERLLACLDHENSQVVEAALSAICTLLDDKVDVDRSVSLLSGMQATEHVLNVVKEHRDDNLCQKSLWVIERFLTKGREDSISVISQDGLFPATLIHALQRGDGCTRQIAEKILRHMNRMPDYSITLTM